MTDLNLSEYERYGRQMLLPEIGKPGQLRLKNSSALIIGVGGLGCPCIAYLAGAGVGTLGLVDHDTVELSNSHRQILHTANHIGEFKVESAKQFVNSLNDEVTVNLFPHKLQANNVISIVRDYDVVLDCTDNQYTRYLISDACVELNKPLISGSALKGDGQMTVYNYLGGPCYRCLFPCPTVAELVQTCGEAGVLGPVVGLIGTLQALEAIKVICGTHSQPYTPTMTIFSAWDSPQWRSIRLRKRKPDCAACGVDSPKDVVAELSTRSTCALTSGDLQAPLTDRLKPEFIKPRLSEYLIIDVRNETEFGIVHLDGSINIDLERLDTTSIAIDDREVLCVCRTGKDSQNAAYLLSKRFPDAKVYDLDGGLKAYAAVDHQFPVY